MSFLTKLTLSEKSPNDSVSPADRRRRKLLEKLDRQIEAVKLALENKPAMQQVQRWVKPEGAADKQLISKLVPIRKWWWTSVNGQVMLSLRQGSRVMELAPGKTAIEVGQLSALPEVLDTIRQAVENGELDAQLNALASAIPVAKKATK